MHVPTVENIMSTNLITLNPDQDIYDAMQTLIHHHISGAPVVDENKALIGIISEKDCLKVFSKSAFVDEGHPPGQVSDYMSEEVITCHRLDDLFIICDRFFEHSFRRLPVVEDDKLVGLISRRDVLMGCLKVLKDASNDSKWSGPGYIPDDLKAKLKMAHSSDQSAIRVDAT